jgi:amidase
MATTDWRSPARPTAGALAGALAARAVSAVELFEDAVARIEGLDGPINAVVVRDFDRARAAAEAADAALARGERRPLLGVPMTVKEAFDVAGLPTTWGRKIIGGGVADTDAIPVARLKAAGAVILGKTNVSPMLADWQSDNPVYGRTTHPLNAGLTPGGSSGGSAAALAAGMVPLELGSDIGGSIRVPAAFCGVYGHKPSFGLVCPRGHKPPGRGGGGTPALNVVGPLARCTADLSLALDVLAGPPPEEAIAYSLTLPPPRHERLKDYRVLVVSHHPLAALDDEIRAALLGLAGRLEAEGASVAYETDLLPDLAAAHRVYAGLLDTAMSRGAPPRPGGLSAHAWMDLADQQLAVRRQWRQVFEAFDVVLAPIFGVVAFPHDDGPFAERVHRINGQDTPYGDQLVWPGMATLANLPATAVPIAATRAGLPIGIQIIGPYLEDRTPLAFAALLEGV